MTYERGTPAREAYWFDVPESAGPLGAERGDAWLTALLPVAVTLHEPARLALPVDPRLRIGARRLMEIWASWYPPSSFPDSLDLRDVGMLECRHPWDFRELRDLRRLAAEVGRPDLERALTRAMRRSRLHDRLPGLRRRAAALVRHRWKKDTSSRAP